MLMLATLFDLLERVQAVRANRDKGATAVEYGLLVAAIAAVIVIVVFALGGLVHSAFSNTCKAISSGGSGLTTSGSCS